MRVSQTGSDSHRRKVNMAVCVMRRAVFWNVWTNIILSTKIEDNLRYSQRKTNKSKKDDRELTLLQQEYLVGKRIKDIMPLTMGAAHKRTKFFTQFEFILQLQQEIEGTKKKVLNLFEMGRSFQHKKKPSQRVLMCRGQTDNLGVCVMTNRG